MVKYFGLLSDIVSDRDAWFMEMFWTYLFQLMGSKLKFSITNHLWMDGQAEKVNTLLEEYYLRHYVTTN